MWHSESQIGCNLPMTILDNLSKTNHTFYSLEADLLTDLNFIFAMNTYHNRKTSDRVKCLISTNILYFE